MAQTLIVGELDEDTFVSKVTKMLGREISAQERERVVRLRNTGFAVIYAVYVLQTES